MLYSLWNCYTFEQKLFFPATITLWKKIISCLKMNLCVCVSKVGVSDKARRGLFCVRIGKTIKIQWKRWNRKEGSGKKYVKTGGWAGSTGECLTNCRVSPLWETEKVNGTNAIILLRSKQFVSN